jgi:hypothetical protein
MADPFKLEIRFHADAHNIAASPMRKIVPVFPSLQVKGGAFENTESDYFRWVVGSGNAIGALDECVRYLHAVRAMSAVTLSEKLLLQDSRCDREMWRR